MKSDIKSAENIVSNIIKSKISLFNNEKYILWQINKKWTEIAGEEIGRNSFPKNLYNGKIIVNVNDTVIYHSLVIHRNVVIQKINDIFQKEIVSELEIRKINRKIKRNLIEEMTGKNNKDSEKRENTKEAKENIIKEQSKIYEIEKNKKDTEQLFSKDIDLSFSEIEKIKKSISKIDKKYSDIAEKLEKIALNRKKKDIYLLSSGYIRCKKCKDIFYPLQNQEICPECYEQEENIKLENMGRVITENPLIGEKEAIRKTGTDEYTYYKARDILAQRAYSELLYFYIAKNMEIECSEEYKNEIKKEANIDFEIYVKNYIDYKIGTDNKEIYNIERGKTIRKLRNEKEFRTIYKKLKK